MLADHGADNRLGPGDPDPSLAWRAMQVTI